MRVSEEEVLRFIAASLPSVWALELLLTLKAENRIWTHEELVSTMRASELVVTRALDALVAAGLVSLEASGALYLPVNPDVAERVECAEQLYRTRPNRVRRAIIAASSSSAAAFADAFKFRRGGDD